MISEKTASKQTWKKTRNGSNVVSACVNVVNGSSKFDKFELVWHFDRAKEFSHVLNAEQIGSVVWIDKFIQLAIFFSAPNTQRDATPSCTRVWNQWRGQWSWCWRHANNSQCNALHIAIKFIAITKGTTEKFNKTIIKSITCDHQCKTRGYGWWWQYITAQWFVQQTTIGFGTGNSIKQTTIGDYGRPALTKTVCESLSTRVSLILLEILFVYFYVVNISKFSFIFRSSFDNIPQEPVNEHALLSMKKNRRFGE